MWTSPMTAVMLATLTLLSVAILAVLSRVNKLRHQVSDQEGALRKASETTQAIRELSRSMLQVAAQRPFDVQFPGTRQRRGCRTGGWIHAMLTEMQRRDRARKDAEARLQQTLLFDDLTGLPNRRLLIDRLSHSLAKGWRENRKVALLYIDLDGFKLVNDGLGHSVGDALLGQVAQRMKTRFRQSDTLARIGGDEFTLILEDVQSPEDADTVARGALESAERALRCGWPFDPRDGQHRHQPVSRIMRRRAGNCCGRPTARCLRPNATARTGWCSSAMGWGRRRGNG